MGNDTVDSPEFWEGRYRDGRTAWDIGCPAPPLQEWLGAKAHVPHHRGRALVLGCGRGHDAIALAAAGYEVVAVDFAASAIEAVRERASRLVLDVRCIERDAFELGPEFDRSFDLVFEHTFLSALRPQRRREYVALVARLTEPGGLLLGIFFTGHDPEGPPFGISPDELRKLLEADFDEIALVPVPAFQQGPLGHEHLGQFRRRQAE